MLCNPLHQTVRGISRKKTRPNRFVRLRVGACILCASASLSFTQTQITRTSPHRPLHTQVSRAISGELCGDNDRTNLSPSSTEAPLRLPLIEQSLAVLLGGFYTRCRRVVRFVYRTGHHSLALGSFPVRVLRAKCVERVFSTLTPVPRVSRVIKTPKSTSLL